MWGDFWPSIRRVSSGGWLIIVLLLVGLAAGVIGAWRIWDSMSGTAISGHGMIALGIGAIFTLLLGGGLMALVFYSARGGHDDYAEKDRADRNAGRSNPSDPRDR